MRYIKEGNISLGISSIIVNRTGKENVDKDIGCKSQ